MNPAVYVLNGSNLNMLGKREPHLYRHTTLAEVKNRMNRLADEVAFDMRLPGDQSRMRDGRLDPRGLREEPCDHYQSGRVLF